MEKITIRKLIDKKADGEKTTMLTAYDYPTAGILDQAGVDIILVGDSLGMVVLGYENTLAVTMDDMIHHTKAARRGIQRSLLVGDMPFLSYTVSVPEAVANAGRFLQEGGAHAVKLEGGEEITPVVRALITADIPVMGHLGVTPQAVYLDSGYGMKGKDGREAEKMIRDAQLLEEIGVFALVLEKIPATLAREITSKLKIPTIGIGAGPHCDGQVLVTHDLLGLFDRFRPKFAKRYADLSGVMRDAVSSYVREVREGEFPKAEHSY